MTEVGNQKTEVGNQMTEVGNRKTEVGNPKADDRRQRSDDSGRMAASKLFSLTSDQALANLSAAQAAI